MGAVYLAEDLSTAADADGLRTRVAIKVIKSALVDDPDVVKRFEREAVAVGKLQHPHIVGFRGTGHDAGIHWLAMEYLAGLTLRERIARGAIAWRESLEIIAQITDGLAAAHCAGVVHRDLKPDNVMLVGSGADVVVKLLDFGIAKQVNADAMTMTGTGLIVGTPGFIAPEVIVHGFTDDPRSDLYALGVMWFEMVTATRPFEASTPFALAIKHVQDAPPRPNDVRPFSPIPSPVEAAILRLMEKDPERRPQSAMALAGVIAHLIDVADHPPEPSSSTLRTVEDLGHEQATETGFAAFDSASMPGLVPRPVAPPLTPPPAAPTTVSPPPSSTRTAVAVAVAVVAVIVTVAAIMLSQRPTSTPVTSTQAPPLSLPAPAQALPPPTLPPVPVLAPPPIPTPAPAPAPVPAPVSPIKKPPPPKDKPKLLLD
jgi:serine/threonine-protein kinase